jgi:hypothetical protein
LITLACTPMAGMARDTGRDPGSAGVLDAASGCPRLWCPVDVVAGVWDPGAGIVPRFPEGAGGCS